MELGRLEDKLDKVIESVASIDKTLAGQAVQLADHIRRTALLEDDLKPVKEHVQRLKGVMWVLGGLTTGLVGALELIRTYWR